MSDTIPLSSPLPKLPTFIGRCCREWVMAYPDKPGKPARCGLCGEVPVYERHDRP